MSMPPISFEYACEQCGPICKAHEDASFRAEYGVSFQDFINGLSTWNDREIANELDKWWEELPKDRQQSILDNEISACQSRLDQLKAAKVDFDC